MIDNTILIARRPDAITAEIGEQSVVLDPEDGTFFQLNGSGALIWALLEEPHTVAALCEKLVARHDVSREQCHADVLAFLASIGERGLSSTGG